LRERSGGLCSLGGSCYVSSDVDSGRRNCSSHPCSEEEDQASPQGPSLRGTQYLHEAYVTMYIAKERNKDIAQVGMLTNALLVQ
jgi:hypothetical protein